MATDIHLDHSGHLGVGTNNHVELLAFLELLHREKSHNIGSLQVYGDSKLAIEWMNNHRVLDNL